MKTNCVFRSTIIFQALLYLAEASGFRYIYYSEGSTVFLKGSSYLELMEWFGPAHTNVSVEVGGIDMFGHHIWWNVIEYSQGQFVIPTLPHRNRLQVIRRMGTVEFDLQITNASILDEGLYFCLGGSWFVLKMINSSRMRYKYYPEGSKVLLKCLLDMQWFGPAHFNNSFNQPSVIDLNENRSMWTINRYTEGKSVSPTLPHHNRFKVVRRIQTGNYELQISNASDFDEGLYFCQDSEMPTAYDYYFLKLINETVVSSRYATFEEINEGETKALCCDKTTVWVSKKNKAIIVMHNVNESCYTIQHVNRDDQGNYTCIADSIDGRGLVTTVLKVRYKPEVSIKQGSKENANEGETKKLCCCIESYPTPTLIRWLNGSQQILVAYNVTDICYTFNKVSRYDQGKYTCTAENIIGSGSKTNVLKVYYKPLVSSINDLIEEMNEDEQKKLCCNVDSNPIPTSMIWLNGSREILVTHNVNETCYTIKMINRYDQQNYTCIAENIIGIGSVSVVLIVHYKPEVSIIHDFSEDVHEGGTKKLCCYVGSNPSPTSIRWFNRSQEISVINNATEMCYTIKNVSRYDQGNYTCTAENIIGSGSVRTVLKVKYKPLVLIKHDLIEETNEGETKTFCCYVHSNPAPTSTSWFNENQEISDTHNGTDTCFTIEKVSRYDSGVYTCIAENSIGIGSIATILKVNYKPVVSRKHDLIEEIHEGETKNLCCYVDSNTAITSTRWFNGSQEIFTTDNVTETCYTIKNVSRYDQGIYTCTAENTIGSGSITIVLQVKSNYQLKENAQPLQSVVLGGLLGTIAVLVVGMGILFFHMQRKKKQRILSTINLGSQRGNDDESGHYMEIYTIDESIVMPWQENSRPIIATVERSVVETRDIDTISAGNSSTSSDDDRTASGYLDDGYEHAYNTLLANNRDEGEHVSMNVRDFIFADNDNSIISTVERAVIENVYIGLTSAGHSSTSSDDDRNASVYLDDGYEHPYNTLLANNRDDDEHVYLTPNNTTNNENATPSENADCGCSYELTERDSSPDQAKTHCEENEGDKNNESEI